MNGDDGAEMWRVGALAHRACTSRAVRRASQPLHRSGHFADAPAAAAPKGFGLSVCSRTQSYV